MNEWSFFVQNGWIQDGTIYDGCHHQVKWEWMSLWQIELVWAESEWSESVFEWLWEKITRCLNPKWQWLNPRWQNSRWLPSLNGVRMNEWSFFVQTLGREVWVRVFFVQMVRTNDNNCVWIQDGKTKRVESKMAEFKMAVHHQVESEWIERSSFCANGWGGKCEWSFFLCKWWEPILASVREFERKN